MKRVQYFVLAMLSLLLFSCNEKAKTLKPVSSELSGSLAECFEVVVKDCKIVGNQVYLEFVRIKEGVMEPQITAEFLDENGNVLVTTKVDKNSNNEELRFLLANKVGESSTVAFAIGNIRPTQVRFCSSTTIEENDEILEMAMEVDEAEALIEDVSEVENLSVNLEEESETDEEMEDEDEDKDEGEEEETPAQSVQSTSGKDWDKLLDDYESYVDQYIELMKKASSGDMTAMTEYVTFMEKAVKLEEELNKAQNDLSVAQSQRLVKISKKMTDAAINM